MTDQIAASAEMIAEAIRAEGLVAEVSHWMGDAGSSSYVKATASNGKKWAKFGVRVSDHPVSSSRYHRDADDVQHYIDRAPTDAQMAAIIAMARRAKAHVG